MIRVLLVDDERLALMQLELLLKEFSNIHIIGTCTAPREAMEQAERLQPDAIFMDIHMPEMSGMKAAEMILQAHPDTDIIFVTAYDAYALEAFELNALDYVLKPVQRLRLGKTIQRLEEQLSRTRALAQAAEAQGAWLHAFGLLGCSKGGSAPQAFKWRTLKAQELYAYLLHHRGRTVSKDTLLELLWPDFDMKKASTHLYTTIYQVRQCLKQSGTGVQIANASGGEGYTLDLNGALLDVAEWEKGIRQAGDAVPGNWIEHQRLFDLYAGEYFGSCGYVWAEGERERLRTIWLHHSSRLARSYADNGKLAEAVTINKRLVELHPYYEEGYLGLMMLYDRIGDRPAVEACFRELRMHLEVELGTKVSWKVWDWYRNWPYARPV